MTQMETIVGLIGLNCGTNGSALMVNESDLKATIRKVGELDEID